MARLGKRKRRSSWIRDRMRDFQAEFAEIKAAVASTEEFYDYVVGKMKSRIRDAIPHARHHVAELQRLHPTASNSDLERMIRRGLVARCSMYGGLSSVPALAAPVSGPGIVAVGGAVVGATIIETGLTVKEQVSYVVQLLLVRGFQGSDDYFVDQALPYAFGFARDQVVRQAVQKVAGEMAETVAERLAVALAKRLATNASIKAIPRMVPVAGIVFGSGLSAVQARLASRRIRKALPAGPPTKFR